MAGGRPRSGRRPRGSRSGLARGCAPERSTRPGDLSRTADFNILWIRTDEDGRLASGRHRGLPRRAGGQGIAQMVGAVVDQQLPTLREAGRQRRLLRAQSAGRSGSTKLDVKPPGRQGDRNVIASGDFQVSTIGDNLPNEQESGEDGYQELLLNSRSRLQATRGAKVAVELSDVPGGGRALRRYGAVADNPTRPCTRSSATDRARWRAQGLRPICASTTRPWRRRGRDLGPTGTLRSPADRAGWAGRREVGR